MTRKEAVEFLIVTQNISPEHMMELLEALEQEPCDDAISRQVVLEAIEDDKSERYSCFASNNDAECFKQIIRELPSVSPQQKVGRWKFGGTCGNQYDYYEWYICSICKETVRNHLYNYCPHCGAKMEVEE